MLTSLYLQSNGSRSMASLASLFLLILVPAFAARPVEQQKLVADDGAPEDFFGYSVAISGDIAIVGSFKADDEVKGVDAGSTYVFTRSGTIWRQQTKLTAIDGAANDTLGGNVALSGETAVAGAIGHDENGDNSGAAYVFERSGNVLKNQTKLTAADGESGDLFGWSVAMSQDTKMIAAIRNDDKGNESGSAYLFDLGSD